MMTVMRIVKFGFFPGIIKQIALDDAIETVEDLMEDQGEDPDEVKEIIINRKEATLKTVLRDGDFVSIVKRRW